MEVTNQMSIEMLGYWAIGALVAMVSARVIWMHKTELFVAVGMPPALVSGVGLIVYVIGGMNAISSYAIGLLVSAIIIFGFAMLQRWAKKQSEGNQER